MRTKNLTPLSCAALCLALFSLSCGEMAEEAPSAQPEPSEALHCHAEGMDALVPELETDPEFAPESPEALETGAQSLARRPTINVPFPCNKAYRVTQAPGGSTSHTGMARWAWDFASPIGALVTSPVSGRVRMVKGKFHHPLCQQLVWPLCQLRRDHHGRWS